MKIIAILLCSLFLNGCAIMTKKKLDTMIYDAKELGKRLRQGEINQLSLLLDEERSKLRRCQDILEVIDVTVESIGHMEESAQE